MLLELPRFNNYPSTILLSGGLLLVAHLCFLLQITGPVIPLVLLGIGYASFGVAFWPAVANSILDNPVTEPELHTPFLAANEISQGNPTLGLDGAAEELGDNASDLRKGGGEDLVVVGYGIMTSFLNLSTGVVPILLAGMEVLAGYSGIEMVFVALATISVFASVRLVKIDRVVR